MLEAKLSGSADVVTLDAQPLPTGVDSASPPAEVRLLPAGTFRTTKGNFVFDAKAAKSVLEKAADWGNQYCFDMGHAMVAPDFGSDPAATGRAYGWYDLKLNDAGDLVTSGLKWTDLGASMLTKREVRYISPAIRTDKDGRVVEFINAALTNLPATKGMKPIVASLHSSSKEEHHAMDPILLAALGLSKAASDSEALSAVTGLSDFVKQVTALTGKSAADSVEEIATWKERSSEVAALTATVVKMKAKKDEKKVQALVAKALEDKVIPPSLKEQMLETGRKDKKLLKSVLKHLTPLTSQRAVGAEKVKAKDEKAQLSDFNKSEQEVLKTLGLTPEAFAAGKASGVPPSGTPEVDEPTTAAAAN